MEREKWSEEKTERDEDGKVNPLLYHLTFSSSNRQEGTDPKGRDRMTGRK